MFLRRYTPGCLVRLDGPIPRYSKLSDWQQGLGFAHLPVGGPVHISVVPIQEGRMFFGSKVYNAQNPAALATQVANVTGIKQLAV